MFLDSCIRQIYPYRTVSEATAMPEKSYPVYFGSGSIVSSVDATGMQGGNNIVQDAFAASPESADMYVVGQGMVGDTLNPNNTIPYGWFDYDVEIDGKQYDTAAILRSGSKFRRDNDIYRGRVTTSYILDKKVKLEIIAWAPFGTKNIIYEIRACSYNQFVPHAQDVHSLRFTARLNLTTRRGNKPIFEKESADLSGGKLKVEVQGHEHYKKTISFVGRNCGDWLFNDHSLTQKTEITAGPAWSEPTIFVFAFDDNPVDPKEAGTAHLRSWADYYAQCGDIFTGNAEEEFLYHNSLYLLRFGFDDVSGYPIGHPFFFPGCWNQCMFWDMHFVFNGLLRANDLAAANRIMNILLRSMRSEGKPYPWMFIYDGTTFLDDARDIAPLVIAAHAMTAVKYYEYTLDKKALKEKVWPIVSRCCEYATEAMFRKEKDGKWIVALAVSNDVVDEEGDEINQTFTTVWFLTLLRKAIEYAPLVGASADPRWSAILNNYRLEVADGEYLQCRNMSAAKARWASWIPFIAYPTEGMPFLEKQVLNRTREKYNYRFLYLDKQNCFQPWTELIEAEAAHRTEEKDVAYDMVRYAQRYVFGDGYFCEVGPMQQTCGYPPYISAHGQYLSVMADLFFGGSVWEKSLRIGCDFPEVWKGKRLRAERLHACKGVFAESIEYSGRGCKAVLILKEGGYSVQMRVPSCLEEEDIRLFVDGVEREFSYDWKKRSIAFVLSDRGHHALEIR